MSHKLKLIVAMCNNRGIGNNNKIPWKIKKDLIYFSACTSGEYGKCMKMDKITGHCIKKNAIIMGKNTWNSLPKFPEPLPYRDNIILTTTIPENESTKSYEYFCNNDKCSTSDLIMYFSSISRAMSFCYPPIIRYDNGDGTSTEVLKEDEREKRENMRNSSINNSEIEYYHRYDNIWIIGGSQIYNKFMEENINEYCNLYIDEFYITYIDKEYICDTFFPVIQNIKQYYVKSFDMYKSNDGMGCEVDTYYIVIKRIPTLKNCDNNDDILQVRVCVDSHDSDSDNHGDPIYHTIKIEESLYKKGIIESKHIKMIVSLFENSRSIETV